MHETTEPPQDRIQPLRSLNMILVTMCVSTLVFATIALIIWIWRDDFGATMGRLIATAGIVLVSSLLGLTVNSISGRSLGSTLPLICWAASWFCILGGAIVGCIALWAHDADDEILLKTIGTIIVLFVSSTIGAALSATFVASSNRV
ncbi:MAG: hypothetical protein GY895_21900 [Phycisphaera sp.]|nr:hypothetical protein [Phycisphaera sp.]